MATNTYEEVLNWSVEDVAVWARAAHVNEETIGILAHPNNQISGRALITLTYLEYVNVCHVPIGRAFELMHAISALKADFGEGADVLHIFRLHPFSISRRSQCTGGCPSVACGGRRAWRHRLDGW